MQTNDARWGKTRRFLARAIAYIIDAPYDASKIPLCISEASIAAALGGGNSPTDGYIKNKYGYHTGYSTSDGADVIAAVIGVTLGVILWIPAKLLMGAINVITKPFGIIANYLRKKSDESILNKILDEKNVDNSTRTGYIKILKHLHKKRAKLNNGKRSFFCMSSIINTQKKYKIGKYIDSLIEPNDKNSDYSEKLRKRIDKIKKRAEQKKDELLKQKETNDKNDPNEPLLHPKKSSRFSFFKSHKPSKEELQAKHDKQVKKAGKFGEMLKTLDNNKLSTPGVK